SRTAARENGKFVSGTNVDAQPVAQAEAEETQQTDPESPSPDSATMSPAREGELARGFSDRIADITGKSRRTAQRDLKVAKSFTGEQLDALEPRELTKKDMLKMAEIEDETKRSQVVSLVAASMDVKEAMKTVDEFGNDTAEVERRVSETALTDEEWLATF